MLIRHFMHNSAFSKSKSHSQFSYRMLGVKMWSDSAVVFRYDSPTAAIYWKDKINFIFLQYCLGRLTYQKRKCSVCFRSVILIFAYMGNGLVDRGKCLRHTALCHNESTYRVRTKVLSDTTHYPGWARYNPPIPKNASLQFTTRLTKVRTRFVVSTFTMVAL